MNRRLLSASLVTLLAAAAPALAQPGPTTPAPGEQPDPAVPATPPVAPAGADTTPPTAPVPVSDVVPDSQPKPPPSMRVPEPKPETKKETSYVAAKWDSQLYGFVEFDAAVDSTQGLNDLIGNAAIPKEKTYAGDHGQMTYGARNSRIGYKLGAPTYHGVKATAQLEMDFLGNQAAGTSEAAFYNNPVFRFRHMNMKLETDVVDILVGQYWELFGWQSYFHPNTVEIQGVPGQVYSRTTQIRIAKTIKSDAINVDLAIAALRPPERGSATPDGQAGIKLSVNHWKGWHTAGSTGSALDSAAIGVSVLGRRFAVEEFSATPHSQVVKYGAGVSIDALLPIVPGKKDDHANALTLTASYAKTSGAADVYTGLSGGVSNAALPAGPNGTAPTLPTNIDGGLAVFTSDGVLHPVHWQSAIVGLQYYLPPSGKVWVSGNYSHINSDNAADLGGKGKVWDKEDWFDANLFFDATPAVRFGLEYAHFKQHYNDDLHGTDDRVQLSGFFIF